MSSFEKVRDLKKKIVVLESDLFYSRSELIKTFAIFGIENIAMNTMYVVFNCHNFDECGIDVSIDREIVSKHMELIAVCSRCKPEVPVKAKCECVELKIRIDELTENMKIKDEVRDQLHRVSIRLEQENKKIEIENKILRDKDLEKGLGVLSSGQKEVFKELENESMSKYHVIINEKKLQERNRYLENFNTKLKSLIQEKDKEIQTLKENKDPEDALLGYCAHCECCINKGDKFHISKKTSSSNIILDFYCYKEECTKVFSDMAIFSFKQDMAWDLLKYDDLNHTGMLLENQIMSYFEKIDLFFKVSKKVEERVNL